jgi:hypothetical protein
MTTLKVTLILILLLPAPAAAMQAEEPPPRPPQRDGFAFGILATPALEGGGPWFMPAIRVSAPLGARHALDFDSGAIFLATNEFAGIKSFLAAQLRFARAPAGTSTTARYWLAGLRYVPITKLTADGGHRRTEDLALMIGHGWKETFANGTRVLSEIGFAGGSGVMAYVTIGVQIGARPSRTVKAAHQSD